MFDGFQRDQVSPTVPIGDQLILCNASAPLGELVRDLLGSFKVDKEKQYNTYFENPHIRFKSMRWPLNSDIDRFHPAVFIDDEDGCNRTKIYCSPVELYMANNLNYRLDSKQSTTKMMTPV